MDLGSTLAFLKSLRVPQSAAHAPGIDASPSSPTGSVPRLRNR